MSKTAIQWTEESWNPIVGCSIKSPGCAHCYAMPMAARIEAANQAAREEGRKVPAPQYDGTTKQVNGHAVWTGKLAMAGDNTLLGPLKRKKPTTYFVNSMGDLFHEDVPDEWIDQVFAVMALCPRHTFQVLTKRAARMRGYLSMARAHPVGLEALHLSLDAFAASPKSTVGEGITLQGDIAHLSQWPLPNVWLGVSAERQQEADERIPELLKTPASVRFVSLEPLLGPINLTHLEHDKGQRVVDATNGCHAFRDGNDWEHSGQGYSLDWVIVGGESGSGARPMHPDWARDLRDQCAAVGVAFFFKQYGHWSPTHPDWPDAEAWAVANDGTVYLATDIAYPDGKRYGEALRAGHDKAHLTSMYPIGKHKAGRLLDGVEHNEMPQ